MSAQPAWSLKPFLCARNFCIYCVHNLSKYQPAFNGITTPWDDGIFGFLGEMTSNFCTSVQLPPKVLTTIQVRAYTAIYMRDNLADLDDTPRLFGVPPPDHVDSNIVTVQGIMILPAPYVPLLIQGRGYTPQEVWNLLLPLLVDANHEEDCHPLIDLLRTASTARGKLLLPGLSQLSNGIENAIATMATAIVQQTDKARTARETKKLEVKTPKLPLVVDNFKHTLHILTKLFNVDNEDALPILWHEWANCGKKQELCIIKDLLDNYAQSQHHFVTKSPIGTPNCYFDLEKSMGLFGDLLGVMLGKNHVITTSYHQFWELLSLTLPDNVHD